MEPLAPLDPLQAHRPVRDLQTFPVLGIDTSIFIYHLESHPGYLPLTTKIFTSIECGEKAGLTSTISLMEITVRPLKLGFSDIARKHEVLLVNFPNLKIVDIDREAARQAAQLRAEFAIHPADALQVGACLAHDVRVLITNDRRLIQLRPKIEVILLDDLLNQ